MTLGITQTVFANNSASDGHGTFAYTFLWIAVILLLSKLGSVVEKFGLPSVLGELTVGIILGNLSLLSFDFFEPIKQDTTLRFLAELGVVILLFQVGLESNVTSMKQVGLRASLVALVGVIVPFVMGAYILGPFVFTEGTPQHIAHGSLFLGATLTATSVGITARVFKDLRALHLKEARIILGAAVIDDIVGLMILSVIQSIVITGQFEILEVIRVAFVSLLFLFGGLILGRYIGIPVARIISSINKSSGAKLGLALAMCLFFAYIAHSIGLAPIVGAFTAGLLLDEVFFSSFDGPSVIPKITAALGGTSNPIAQEVTHVLEEHTEKHLEEIIEPIGQFLMPIFFIVVGLDVRLDVLFQPSILLIALGVTIMAVLGKIVSGFVAGKGTNKLLIGWGMVPRGEVGLIFASVGKGLGVVNDELFSVIVIVVIMTTLLTPPILSSIIRRNVQQ
ncbi:MAG: cation:proton antiporter [Ignavibacteria bacterium]|jgi:Kef-type K+ transport system membrane component KefB|nr:cation:proton antiporter [Ignavibacteria bacterium]